MTTKNDHPSAAVNTLFWATLIGLLIQAGVIFFLPRTTVMHKEETENIYMGLPVLNLLNS